MVEHTKLSFDSHGVNCAARLYRPTNAARRLPCVVMGHGFSGTMGNLVAYAEQFTAAGMAVFMFDYRHCGESGGEPRQLIDVKRQREDWRAAIHRARQCDGVDPDRIALWGSSLSGGHVIAVAAADPRVAAVVAQVPLIDSYRGGGSAKTPALLMLRLFASGVRDALRGRVGRPPYLVPVYGKPGTVASFTDPALKPFFDALALESPTWRNAFSARLVLFAPRYRRGTAERIAVPLLVCVADQDAYTSPSFAAWVADRAPYGAVKHYPVGHFDLYPEMNSAESAEVIADQISFLRAHLHVAISEPALVATG